MSKNWDIWEQNWINAAKFFNSRGNINTKAKLKKKWLDNFNKDFVDVIAQAKLDALKELETLGIVYVENPNYIYFKQKYSKGGGEDG